MIGSSVLSGRINPGVPIPPLILVVIVVVEMNELVVVSVVVAVVAVDVRAVVVVVVEIEVEDAMVSVAVMVTIGADGRACNEAPSFPGCVVPMIDWAWIVSVSGSIVPGRKTTGASLRSP